MFEACLVNSCHNKTNQKNISWYIAPINSWKEIWQITLCQTYDDYQIICSEHFSEESFDVVDGARVLKPGRLPIVSGVPEDREPDPDYDPIVIQIDEAGRSENREMGDEFKCIFPVFNRQKTVDEEEPVDFSDSEEEVDVVLENYMNMKDTGMLSAQIVPNVIDVDHLKGEYLTCFVCGICCSNSSTLRAHLKDHPKKKERKACTMCGSLFISKCENCPLFTQRNFVPY